MKIRTTPDRYVADARSLGGGEKWFPKTPAGKRQAQAHLRKVQAEHERLGAYTNAAQTPIFADAVRDYLAYEETRVRLGELGAPHIDNKRCALETIGELTIGAKRISDMRLGDMRAGLFKAEVLPQLFALSAYSTAGKKFTILQHMMKWAVETELLAVNQVAIRLPRRRKRKRNLIERIKKEAVNAVIDHAEPRYKLPIKFAAYTGLRAGEQLALTWDDIDFDAGLVRVNKAVKKDGSIGEPKTDAGHRQVEIADMLLADLRAWKLAQPIEQRRKDLVFPSTTGGLNNVSNLRNRGLKPACEAAGVEVIRWHDLRHFFASVLLFDTELSLPIITELVGHHNISFTLSQYGHWLPEARRAGNISAKLTTAFGG